MLEVIEPGLLTTVQDAGRPSAVSLGVPVGGACDRWGLAAANALLGNDEAAAALEMTLSGATFRALADCAVAVGGAEMGGRVVETGQLLATGSAAVLRARQTLTFAAAERGVRAYVALAGGVDVPAVMGSRSACLAGGFGGLGGRALRAGDIVRPAEPGRPTDRPAAGGWNGPPALFGGDLRVVRGPHLDRLAGAPFDELLAAEWQVGVRGNRQGITLDGRSLAAAERRPMLSEGVVWGTIQLPPNGLPIVLLADHQTVGGYPAVAVVIAADRPLLGQLAPTETVAFSEVTLDDARAALMQRRRALERAMRHAATG